MRSLLVVLVLAALSLAAIRFSSRATTEERSAEVAGELLSLPLGGAAVSTANDAGPPADSRSFGQGLLESSAVERDGATVVLKLGQVIADPTAARLAAEAAGELLCLSVSAGEAGTGGELPLWRAVLAGPAAEKTPSGTRLRMNGCRHTANFEDGPALEDTYYARLAIAQAFRELAADASEYGELSIEGEETPVAGGANFDVQLSGEEQGLVVTVDKSDAAPLTVSRTVSFAGPNDAVARRSLVRGLRELAAKSSLDLRVEGEEAPAPGGVDLRIELLGIEQTLRALLPDRSGLRARRTWSPDER